MEATKEPPDDRQKCICDTSVLNRLYKIFPDFYRHLHVIVPASMKVSKEARTNQRFLRHISRDEISVIDLCEKDRKHVATLIKQAYGKKGRVIAELYLSGKMQHDKVEYDCMGICDNEDVPLFIFDDKAESRAKKVLKNSKNVENIVNLVDYMPITAAEKENFLHSLEQMNYPPAIKKIDELGLSHSSPKKK